jgi:hypothetical protein
MIVVTTPTDLLAHAPLGVSAVVGAAAAAAVTALALALGWVSSRVAGGRVRGGIPLRLGAVAAFLALMLLETGHLLLFLLGAVVAVIAVPLVAAGGLLLASDRSAVRAAFFTPAAAPGGEVRAVSAVALAVGAWSLAAGVDEVVAWMWSPRMMMTVSSVLVFVVWSVGRAAMVAGCVALLGLRPAGTFVYTAGFAVTLSTGLALGWGPRSLALLAVDVATVVLAWIHVRAGLAASPSAQRQGSALLISNVRR